MSKFLNLQKLNVLPVQNAAVAVSMVIHDLLCTGLCSHTSCPWLSILYQYGSFKLELLPYQINKIRE